MVVKQIEYEYNEYVNSVRLYMDGHAFLCCISSNPTIIICKRNLETVFKHIDHILLLFCNIESTTYYRLNLWQIQMKFHHNITLLQKINLCIFD